MGRKQDVAKKQSNRKESGTYVPLDFTFGMPPDNLLGETNTLRNATMPEVRIYPGVPAFKKGSDLFSRTPVWDTSPDGNNLAYHNLLKKHGFSIPAGQNFVKAAYLADSFPTDSFTNEYGENFLQQMTGMVSEKMQSLAQMFGTRDAGAAVDKLTRKVKESGLPFAEMIGGAMGAATEGTGKFLRSLPIAGGGVDMVSAMLMGGRLDFPMVWKSSGFQPSYTMTIRLYNPNPSSQETTNKYIVGPIAALMLLGIPLTTEGVTYSWPYIHRIESPGIYDLEPAFISNVTIIKGGDQQSIGWNQLMGIVDVRIDFGSLYSSMLASPVDLGKDRPTLKKYLDGMRNFKETSDRLGQDIRNEKIIRTDNPRQAPTVVEKTAEEKQNPPSRVGTQIKEVADDLLALIPDSIRDLF